MGLKSTRAEALTWSSVVSSSWPARGRSPRDLCLEMGARKEWRKGRDKREGGIKEGGKEGGCRREGGKMEGQMVDARACR